MDKPRQTATRLGALALLWLCALIGLATPARAATACPSVLKHTQARLQDEKPVDLCQYSGKVLLVVNTASKCGYTGQYKALEELHARYGRQGLVVLGFPSGDFWGQELQKNSEIAEFCQSTYGVQFPMFTKSHVVAGKGGPVNPVFAELTERTGKAPGWNFTKYLVHPDGQQVLHWSSRTEPDDPKVVQHIEAWLKAAPKRP